MPVRVLDRAGDGDSVAISAGIRYAARKGAKVINLSFEFDSSVTRGQIPDILDALRYARRKGALVVGASGNVAAARGRLPGARERRPVGRRDDRARLPGRLLQRRQRASTSSRPAAALDADIPGDPNCRPGAEPAGRDIYQMTYSTRLACAASGCPSGYVGTSMAAPHVVGDRRARDRLRRDRPEPDARRRSRRG